MIPLPTQISGAEFLAARRRAFLWDSPRVGKTGAAIMAADQIGARTILVVTTASGRGVWRRAFPAWQKIDRRVKVFGVDRHAPAEVAIASWGMLEPLGGRVNVRPDLIILDEDHKAANPATARTQHVYGRMTDGGQEMLFTGVVQPGDRVWHLSGLPCPHDLGNMWPRMRASCPERLTADGNWPDVTRYDDFRARYCVIRHKRLRNNERIPIVVGGQNADELRARLAGMSLRRTQRDVGIAPPRYEIMPLIVTAAQRREADGDTDQRKIIEAAEEGRTKDLEMQLGPLRRLTGMIKAGAVVTAAREEFGSGVEKLVIAYWHRDVGDALHHALLPFGVARLDGATPAREREAKEREFRQKNRRVFLAQIAAAGEAIDLSPSDELWFAETSFTPSDMEQMAQRIVNVGKQRSCFVRVCCLEGTIDEAMQASLMRLWAPIREVLQ